MTFTGSRTQWLDVLTSGILISVAVAVAWVDLIKPHQHLAAASKVPDEPIPMADAYVVGDRSAPVGVIEYADFQCPFCRRFASDSLPSIESKYVSQGRIRFAFVNFPLQIHQYAAAAADAAMCADRNQRFWPMHNHLFASPDLSPSSLASAAQAVGVSGASFDTCMREAASPDSPERKRLEKTRQTAEGLDVTGTPTFFIGVVQRDGRLKALVRLVGAVPLTEFESKLDAVFVKISAR